MYEYSYAIQDVLDNVGQIEKIVWDIKEGTFPLSFFDEQENVVDLFPVDCEGECVESLSLDDQLTLIEQNIEVMSFIPPEDPLELRLVIERGACQIVHYLALQQDLRELFQLNQFIEENELSFLDLVSSMFSSSEFINYAQVEVTNNCTLYQYQRKQNQEKFEIYKYRLRNSHLYFENFKNKESSSKKVLSPPKKIVIIN